ncbi:hypothetical protein AN639_12870 [Candidatus Epulonipiscium fishelsonii]|uniref:Uncharacterized protein n=1 Tax=Candidatus Epulonipiscium fishelsonii TaxID=77094 RepID=A0ACC8XDF6_9FIRM|nr:hypothetical protein AN396_00805 [Epulopiscium sp. SCG-B11WGA-EpuloA1]ONI42183.1 hypothetical protein AN639_12870 [Epulopiscium sp. SCG-B05WGA-EpuloA1]
MKDFLIIDNKLFMKKLLKDTIFNEYEVYEIVLNTFTKFIIEGKRNTDFYSEQVSECITWKEIQAYIYFLVSGKTLPTYFKFVLFKRADPFNLFLNIVYKDNIITCITGCSYKTFTLDKSIEQDWDSEIQNFLLQNNFL